MGGDIIEFAVSDHRDIAAMVESEDYIQRFKAKLNENDRAILELREEGYTLEEISVKRGYKTHSAVVKRIQAIKEAYLEYDSKNK